MGTTCIYNVNTKGTWMELMSVCSKFICRAKALFQVMKHDKCCYISVFVIISEFQNSNPYGHKLIVLSI